MSVVPITKTSLPGVNAVTGTAFLAGSAAMPVTNGTDSYTFANTGAEMAIVINTTAGALTVTITGVADPYGRSGNFSMSIPGSAALATVSGAITPKLSSSLFGSTTTFPATNPAGLALCVVTGV